MTSPDEPLRILQLNSLLTGGGTDDQCVKLALGLHQLGQNVRVAGPEGREFSKVIRDLGLPFWPIPRQWPVKVNFIKAVANLVRKERIQIVHGHHGRDFWRTVIAAKLSGTKPKIILTRHLAKSPSSWFTRRFLPGRCDAIVAVSNFVAKVLREGVREPDSPEPERWDRPPLLAGRDKIQVIHGGIDTGRFHPFDARTQRQKWGLEPGDYAFAVVGAYTQPRGKGQREFLQAAARVHGRIPQARFLMIGRGDLTDVLRGDIERLGLAGKAQLTPYCLDMPAAMNAIDCLVHPATGTEAFPGVVLEAQACGKPVIASSLDGVPEAFAAGGFGQLVKPYAIDELAAAMVDWAGRPPCPTAEREALHRKMAENYSVLAFGGRMLKFYQQVMAGRAGK